MGCHSLFQGIFLTQGSNLGLLHCMQILYHSATREAQMGNTKYYYAKPKDSRLEKVQKSWVFYRRKRPSKPPAICSHFSSPPTSSVEVNSSVCVCVCVCVCVTQLCLTLCNPMGCSPSGSSIQGFSRQEYCSGLTFLSPGYLPDQGLNPGLPHYTQTLYHLSQTAIESCKATMQR